MKKKKVMREREEEERETHKRARRQANLSRLADQQATVLELGDDGNFKESGQLPTGKDSTPQIIELE